jgi:glyoxylase I family protein
LSFSVTDLERSTRWYGDVLGAVVEAEIQGDGFRRVRLRAPWWGIAISLTSHDEELPGPFSERRSGLDHVAFEVDREEIDQFLRRFEQAGVDHSGPKTLANGAVLITVRDPDNIQLELFVPS